MYMYLLISLRAEQWERNRQVASAAQLAHSVLRSQISYFEQQAICVFFFFFLNLLQRLSVLRNVHTQGNRNIKQMHAIKVRNHVGFKDCVLDTLEPETNCPVAPRILLCCFSSA